jgi:cytochrome c553
MLNPTCLVRVLKLALVLMVIALIVPSVFAADKNNVGEKFFEEKVRPVLAEHCFSCHGPDKQKGGLKLDSKAAMIKGGDIGTSIIPGDPAASLMIKAMGYEGDLKMPPKGKLNPRQIADLSAWVKMGAPWPSATTVEVKDTKLSTVVSGKDHWAFQPLRNPVPPEVKNKSWVRNPIDQFVLNKLEAKGLKPARTADKRTLVRRAYFDLLGMPPEPKEVEAFLKDDSSDAFAKLVDKLLASSHYGERWGRHWLDVARYADSNGMDENLAYATAWRYRDWVIQAFNSDMPFDQFIRMQIAGDLLQPNNHDGMIATGFLMVGPKMLAEDDPVKMHMDIVDEQLDTISQSFMGLTMGCARCHDHKFDPISTKEYYSLAGIMKSTRTMETYSVVAKWQERPLAGPMEVAQEKEHEELVKKAKQEIKKTEDKAFAEVVAKARLEADAYIKAAQEKNKFRDGLGKTRMKGDKQVEGSLLIEAESFVRGNVLKDVESYGKGIGVLVNAGRLPNFVEYDLNIPAEGNYSFEIRYAAAESRPVRISLDGKPKGEFAASVTGGWNADAQKWEAGFLATLKKGKLIVRIDRAGPFPHIDKFALLPLPKGQSLDAQVVSTAGLLPGFIDQWVAYLNKGVKIPEGEAFKQLLQSKDGPFARPRNIDLVLPPNVIAALKPLRDNLAKLEKDKPKLPTAMAVSEDKPQDIKIHIRGNHLTLGTEAPRGFPSLIPISNVPKIDEKASGRLQFANWITQPDNPLTPRVAVNRLWTWHFGDGLVRTPDNFGRLGDQPTHQDLLDWLAQSFLQQGWSVKAMHKLIMNSATYQMSTEANAQAELIDSENRLFWHRQRQRLDAESFRDSLFVISDSLDRTSGGSLLGMENRRYVTSTGSRGFEGYNTMKRSVYLPVIRSSGYEPFQAFDFPDPSVTMGRRAVTNIPAQSLLLMNGKLVHDQTRKMAEYLMKQSGDEAKKISMAYEILFSRNAQPSEVQRAIEFLNLYQSAAQAEKVSKDESLIMAWQGLCRSLLSTNEFVFVE